MDEPLEQKLPDKKEHGLSHEEHKWISDNFDVIAKNQATQIKLLDGIHSWMTYFGVLSILSLIAGVIYVLVVIL